MIVFQVSNISLGVIQGQLKLTKYFNFSIDFNLDPFFLSVSVLLLPNKLNQTVISQWH